MGPHANIAAVEESEGSGYPHRWPAKDADYEREVLSLDWKLCLLRSYYNKTCKPKMDACPCQGIKLIKAVN